MIEGVRVTPLKQIADDRGKVMHMLRRDSKVFQSFGEIYFSGVYPGKIKAWHVHKKMTLNYAVPHGEIRLVLYDDRPQSSSRGQIQEIILGPKHYQLVTIPPMVWNGFIGLGQELSLVANCATISHDPDEIVRLDPFDKKIPYFWERAL